MNASFETLAAFREGRDEAEAYSTGFLSSRNGQVEFLTSPLYKVLRHEELEERLHRFGRPPSYEKVGSLRGRTAEAECSLFNLIRIDSPGMLDTSSSEALGSDKYHVGACIVGMHLESPDSEEIESATYEFTDLQEWMPPAWKQQWSNTEIFYTHSLTPLEVFTFSSTSLQAEISCKVLPSKFKKSRAVVCIKPRERRSLEWFSRQIHRLENFLSLFLGTSVAPRYISVRSGDKEGWLVQKRPRKRQKPDLQLWISCEPHEVAGALAKWLTVPEEARAIERVLLSTLRKSSLFLETEFLALAQAVEGFGRIRFNDRLCDPESFRVGLKTIKKSIHSVWGSSPLGQRCCQLLKRADESSFADRLIKTCRLFPSEFFSAHFGEETKFVQAIVQTRNYFTHLGIKPGLSVVDGGRDLYVLNQKLHALLRGVMLIDLGIPFRYLQEPTAYQAAKGS